MENQNEKTIPVQPENAKKNIFSRLNLKPGTIKTGLAVLLLLGLLGGSYYWYTISQRIYTDKAEIYAPLIALGPEQPGILREILVKNGEKISAFQTVARLEGGEFVVAKTDGIVVSMDDEIGKLFSPGMAIVTMVKPDDLRLIAHVAEDKGLSSIRVGQKVIFEVDAFDSKEFYGEVEEIAQSSDQSSVVFSISDKREEKNFSIKIKYTGYPELLDGMSAKAWIYK